MLHYILIIWLLVRGSQPHDTIPADYQVTGYDCSDPQPGSTRISLINQQACDMAEHQEVRSARFITVIASTTESTTSYLACRVVANHLVFRCGSLYDSLYEGGLYSEHIALGRDQCFQLITVGSTSILMDSRSFTISCSTNNQCRINIVTWGTIKDGYCSGGEPLWVRGQKYLTSIRSSEIVIDTWVGIGAINFEQDRMTTREGSNCPYHTTSCTTPEHGNIFWELQEPDCSDGSRVSLLYQGSSIMITRNDGDYFYQVDQDDHHFYIQVRGVQRLVCGVLVKETEHPGVFVLDHDPKIRAPFSQHPSPNKRDILTFIDSKILYTSRHTFEDLNRIFRLFDRERCRNFQRSLRQSLSMALENPSQFAYNLYGKPGYTAIVRGDTVHIIQCKQEAVTLAHPDGKCYNELPILYRGERRYLTPRSLIITRSSRSTPCSVRFPSLFAVNDLWIKLLPDRWVIARPPEEILPFYEANQPDNVKFSQGGLYHESVAQDPNSDYFFLDEYSSGSLRGRRTLGLDLSLGASIEEDQNFSYWRSYLIRKMVDLFLMPVFLLLAFLMIFQAFTFWKASVSRRRISQNTHPLLDVYLRDTTYRGDSEEESRS